MKQQVNLYQPIFRRQRKVFSFYNLLQALGLVALGLLAFYGYARLQVHGLVGEVAALESKRDQATARIENLSRQYPPKSKSAELQAELARLTAEYEGKSRLVGALSGGGFGNVTGFSNYLEALAKQHVGGLWLTQIGIHDGGTRLDLSGSTVDPQLVPSYLQRLSVEDAFAGKEFRSLSMSRPEDDRGRVDFALHTARAGAGP